jgi:hypothetical protein
MAERENSAEHNEKRQKAMYADGPRAKNGKVEAGKKDGGGNGDGKEDPHEAMHARHKRERDEMHDRHMTEHNDSHKRHMTDHDQMNARQDEELAAAQAQPPDAQQQAAAPLQGAASDAGQGAAMGQGAAAAA